MLLSGGEMMKITSEVFGEGDPIPKQYTCDGHDISPPLSWTGIPVGTESLALICDDPDAPSGTWVHWVLFNIPADVSELPENVPKERDLDNGARHGITDFRKIGYGGPCPPGGTHRYYFKLYALDTILEGSPGITKRELQEIMDGHILAQAILMGRYTR